MLDPELLRTSQWKPVSAGERLTGPAPHLLSQSPPAQLSPGDAWGIFKLLLLD